MSDEQSKLDEVDMQLVEGLPLPTRRTRRRIVYTTLLFCALIIVLVTWKGNPANTLHASAQAWAFGLSAAVIFAYVFGAVADNFNVIKSVISKK